MIEQETRLSRRALLAGGMGLAAGAVAKAGAAGTGRDLLLYIFQRGAADGLNMVAPHGDAAYYAARPELAIAAPGKGSAAALDLDGFFGLHPALAPFKRLYDDKLLAVVHACGSPDPTHSHFDGMDYMERGAPGDKRTATGWLGRHLQLTAGATDSPLRAVGMGGLLQTSLRGSPAVGISSIADFHLKEQPGNRDVVAAALRELYGGDGALSGVAAQTFTVLERIAQNLKPDYAPAPAAKYPATPFATALKEIAQLAKSDQGMEIACADIGGWDTHADQGGAEGRMAKLLAELAQSLEAFVVDLGERAARLTVVVMSEFGRRVKQNASRGTDHGHGNCAFVLGGAVNGGRVYGAWPGLQPEQLYGPGDLAVTTDFRDVLSEIVARRLGNARVADVFPSYQPRALELVRS